MSWRITIRDNAGALHDSAPLRTRTDAMTCVCDLKKGAEFISATHTSGETITKDEVETWRRANEAMLKGRASPRQLARRAQASELKTQSQKQ